MGVGRVRTSFYASKKIPKRVATSYGLHRWRELDRDGDDLYRRMTLDISGIRNIATLGARLPNVREVSTAMDK